MSPNDPVIQRALHYLRDFHEPGGTYETSLMIMALVAAHEWDRDKLRIASLAQKLETMQTQRGALAGMWNYGHGQLGGGHEDNSNTQFAVLGLREAAIAGVRIKRRTWELTSEHFIETQNEDGGWGYHVEPSEQHGQHDLLGNRLACVICDQMLGSQATTSIRTERPNAATRRPVPIAPCDAASNGFRGTFAVGVNPGSRGDCGCSITCTAWNEPAGSPDIGFSDIMTGTAKGASG